MFVVYSAAGVPCYRTSDEAEADYMSFCMGGYYAYEAWKIFRESNFLLGSLFPASIVKILTLKNSQFPRMLIVKKFTIQIVKILTYRSEIVKKLTLIYSQRLLKF